MTNEFVDKNEVLEIIRRTCGDYATAWAKVAHLPSLDVTPIIHGKWCWYPDERDRQELCCSECEEFAPYNGDGFQILTEYCPHCGAKMDKK